MESLQRCPTNSPPLEALSEWRELNVAQRAPDFANRAVSDGVFSSEGSFFNHLFRDPEFQFYLESVDQFPSIFNLTVALQAKEETRHADRLDTHVRRDTAGFLFIKDYSVGALFLGLDNAFGFTFLDFRHQQEHVRSIPDRASLKQASAIQFVQLMPEFLLFVYLCLNASGHVHGVKKEGQLCGQVQVCDRPQGRAVNDRVAHLLLRDSGK